MPETLTQIVGDGSLSAVATPVIVRSERPGDESAIANLLNAAFGGSEESKIVERLRLDRALTVSLVATTGGKVAGHVAFSPVSIKTPEGSFCAIGLAPVGVDPSLQRTGIGTRLIKSGLESCRLAGYDFVVVLGEPDYYRRFGFGPAAALGIKPDLPFDVPVGAFMALELREGAFKALGGVASYSAAFSAPAK